MQSFDMHNMYNYCTINTFYCFGDFRTLEFTKMVITHVCVGGFQKKYFMQNLHKILNHMICITCMVNHFWIDLSNSRIFDDVIPGRLWRHRTKSLCVIQDFGLNFHIFQSVLNFRQPVFLWTLWKEAYFSIFKIEKIDQK